MVLRQRAEAGLASRLDGLSAVMDLKAIHVHGDGDLRIDEDCHPPRMKWNPNRHTGFNLPSQDGYKFEATVRSLQDFKAEAVALGGPDESTLDPGSLEHPRVKSDLGPKEEAQLTRTKHDAYMARMKQLQNEALHDGYAMNLTSEVDFRQFIQSAPEIRKGNLVLMDNGNLRASWKDGQRAHLGLQFLGGGMVQYVIFKCRTQGQQTSRVAGRDSLEGVERQIEAFELHSLLYG